MQKRNNVKIINVVLQIQYKTDTFIDSLNKVPDEFLSLKDDLRQRGGIEERLEWILERIKSKYQ